MTTNTKINIILGGIIISLIVFGGYFLLKNVPVETPVQQERRGDGGVVLEQAEVAALQQEITEQIKEKQSQFEKLNNQIVSAQSACENVVLANVTPQTIKDINKESFSQAVGGFYTCDAVVNKDVGRCNFLRGIDVALFERCVMSAVNIRIAVEKCSAESMNQCIKSGVLTQGDCDNICGGYSRGDSSVCSVIIDPDRNKGCLAFTQKKIELCEEIADVSQRASCVNGYYFYSAIKDNDAGLLNKMGDSFNQSIGKIIFGADSSCGNEFSGFINTADCVAGSLGDYDAMQKELDVLQNEIVELNQQINALQ